MTDTKVSAAFDGLTTEVHRTVVVPPAARIVAAGRRRRMRNRLAVSGSALGVLAVVAGVAVVSARTAPSDTVTPAASASATTSPQPAAEGSYRALIEEYLAQNPNRPIVVPRSLPAGYAMLNPFDYYPTKPGLPGIRLCVMSPEATSVKGECVGTSDTSPWTEVNVDGLRVVLVTASPPESLATLEVWKALTFTADWPSVGWLDQQRPT